MVMASSSFSDKTVANHTQFSREIWKQKQSHFATFLGEWTSHTGIVCSALCRLAEKHRSDKFIDGSWSRYK